MTNTSYYMKFNNITENCTEATYQIINGEEFFNCTKCINDNVLTYIKRKDIFVCKFVENDIEIQDSSSSIFSEGIDTISDSITTFSDKNETEIIVTETKKLIIMELKIMKLKTMKLIKYQIHLKQMLLK